MHGWETRMRLKHYQSHLAQDGGEGTTLLTHTPPPFTRLTNGRDNIIEKELSWPVCPPPPPLDSRFRGNDVS